MASTYALPITPTSHSHSHERSRSHYSPYTSAQSLGSSPLKEQGHRHHQSDMNGSGQMHGAVRSPYAEYNGHTHTHSHGNEHNHDHGHSHGHGHSRSTDSTWTLQPFINGRTKGRTRGESDLGRSPPRKNGSLGKYGFSPVSPIQESTSPGPGYGFPPPSSSWLQLPEALTAILIPLPFVFASFAFPKDLIRGYIGVSALTEASVDNEPATIPAFPVETPLLYALILTSATLISVGVIAKIASSIQPLDRRKAEAKTGTFDLATAPKQIVQAILSVFLPFYASLKLDGTKVAMAFLVAVSAGVGALERKPGKQSRVDELKRTIKTRAATCAALVIIALFDYNDNVEHMKSFLGYSALAASLLLVAPPLPMSGWTIKTASQSHDSERASLPKPTSPLINSFESTLLTLAAGLSLTVVTILFSLVTSSFPLFSQHNITFSVLSIASAAAFVYFPIPTALRTPKKVGLAIGSLVATACHLKLRSWTPGIEWYTFPSACVILFGAIMFDTRSHKAQTHGHGHSHSGHDHSHTHDHNDHHLHGNHSRLSAFLIARTTSGSILHSVLIEKDSRRIAYFGVLNLAFMLVQFFYGFVSGSLGLLTDSIHMLFDCAGLAVGLVAAVMSKWRPNARFPYGYGKIDTLSGFANGVFLLLVSVEIIFDAFERLWEGHELQRLNELLIVSVLGLLVNLVGLTAFGHAHHGHGHSHDHGGHDHGHGHSHDNENMQGIFLHILADALGSVAVIISTLLTKYYGWSGWDPIASCIIAVLIFLSAIPLVKSSGARLMLSLPNDLEYTVRNTLGELGTLRGVVGYSVPKFWLEDEGAAHAEVHAKEDDHSHGSCAQDHEHSHEGHDHAHSHDHSHNDAHSHDHSHSHSHSHPHAHNHHDHSHSHDHDHDHGHSHAVKQRILGVIHVIAARNADLEDVRERTIQFLKGRGMDVVVHVEQEGEGRCWCGGGLKTN